MIKIRFYNYYNSSKLPYLKYVAHAVERRFQIEEDYHVNLVICSNEMIKDYNNRYRHIDKETDVLSFPSDEDNELGDILISYEKAQSQALEYEHSLKREISFLFCHGLLHCYGFDHITKEEEEIMFWHQRHIMDDAGGLESYEKCRKYFEKS